MAEDERGRGGRRRRRRRGIAPSSLPPIAPDGRARPLLGGGEQLAHIIERAPGGAPAWHPRSFEAAAAWLGPQALSVAGAVRRLPDELRGPHVIIEARILPNYLAGSHYPRHLLERVNLYSVGARQSRGTYYTKKRPPRENEPTKTYLLAGEGGAVEQLAQIILGGPERGPKSLWEDIRQLDSLQLPGPETVLRGMPEDAGEGELVTWEAVLTGIGATAGERERYTAGVLEKFIAYVEALSGEVDRQFIRTVDGLTFLPVALTTQDAPDAARFNALRAIRPMPRIRDLEVIFRSAEIGTSAATGGRAEDAVSDTTPAPTTTADTASRVTQDTLHAGTAPAPLTTERVAVFDGGVDLSDPALAPYVRLHPITTAQAVRKAVRHGTIVTNALLYGYAAAEATSTAPLVTVDHYHVIMPPPVAGTADTQFYWVLDQIVKRSVEDGHKLVNLSLGPPRSIEDDAEPNAWTATLDEVAHRHGILFVCAVGNNGQHSTNRIRVPADMANGLAVGACISREPSAPVSRAPYSAVGPGRPGQRIAPAGVAFGGSVAHAVPFRGRGPGGQVQEEEGTSCATPLVTHGLSELRATLRDPRPDTLRAFAAHFAEGQPAAGHDERDIGHGRLRESYADIWDCGPNVVTTMYDLELHRGELLAVPFPMPDGVRPDAELRVVFTVCYTSPVQSQHVSDYTRAGLDITFRPHDRVFNAYDTSTKPPTLIGKFNVDADADQLAKLYANRPMKLATHPVSRSGWRRSRWEGDQRDAGKWDTLVRADRRFAARELRGPRLDLEYLAREGVRLVHERVPPLPTTVLVTLYGPADVLLYDLVRQQVPALGALLPAGRVPVRVRT